MTVYSVKQLMSEEVCWQRSLCSWMGEISPRLKGWVSFVTLSDGSCFETVQLVMSQN